MHNIAQRIPFHIADHSITFFAKGRGFTVGNDNANFDEMRRMLANGIHDVDKLAEMADPRVAVEQASNGLCQIAGNSVMYEGRPLHNVWVDKILSFANNNLPFEPVMLALSDLQKNPTEKARIRLPVFVEQSKLGFFPDGRIAALKYVRDDYKDANSGTFDNSVGKVVEMPREACDADPDQHCSTGLHLGAYDYVTQYGNLGSRIMLCAFWPRDVVAVPRDYNGQKMRVCRYEVLEEMDRDKLVQFIEENSNMLRSYEVRMPPENRLDAAVAAVEAEDQDEEDVIDDEAIHEEEQWEAEKALAAEPAPAPAVTKPKRVRKAPAKKAKPKAKAKKAPVKKKAPAKKAKPVAKKKAPVKKAVKKAPAKKAKRK